MINSNNNILYICILYLICYLSFFKLSYDVCYICKKSLDSFCFFICMIVLKE